MSAELTVVQRKEQSPPELPEVQEARPGHGAAEVPGEYGVWALIFGDFAVFGFFFITYSYYRSQDVALYVASQQTMHGALGLTNTLLLLTSSWLVAVGVQRAKDGNTTRGAWLISGALLCGLGFCLIKALDYHASIQAGIGLTTNEFYIFYFMFTGIHLVHVLIGMGVLLFMRSVISRQAPLSKSDISALQSCGIFWHLVDILWVFLFALFYIMV
jgi:nitric oxide reductase NorE protein